MKDCHHGSPDAICSKSKDQGHQVTAFVSQTKKSQVEDQSYALTCPFNNIWPSSDESRLNWYTITTTVLRKPYATRAKTKANSELPMFPSLDEKERRIRPLRMNGNELLIKTPSLGICDNRFNDQQSQPLAHKRGEWSWSWSHQNMQLSLRFIYCATAMSTKTSRGVLK